MRTAAGIVVVGTLAAIIGGIAFADQPGQPTALSALDKDYLKDTAQSNLEEVQLDPIVQSHAVGAEYKQFGDRMKQDHARANASLKEVADHVGFSLPKDVSDDQKHIMGRLAQFHDASFDTEYKKEMIRDHTGDIADSEREISLGSNPKVIEAARKNLELLQMHLKMSQALPGDPAQK